jgi:hypothetical protein
MFMIASESGAKIPALGFGTWKIELDQTANAVKHALKVCAFSLEVNTMARIMVKVTNDSTSLLLIELYLSFMGTTWSW